MSFSHSTSQIKQFGLEFNTVLFFSEGQPMIRQDQFLIIFYCHSKQSLLKSFKQCVTSVSILLIDFTGCHHHSDITNTDNRNGNCNYGDHQRANPR